MVMPNKLDKSPQRKNRKKMLGKLGRSIAGFFSSKDKKKADAVNRNKRTQKETQEKEEKRRRGDCYTCNDSRELLIE
jgi:hypothetical protein